MPLVWDASRQRRETGGGGAFIVHERIAAGGMAEVFLATRRGAEGFAKPVVLKRILPEYAEDRKFCEMFVREARLGAHLSHPNIVQVLDLGRDAGSLYIALEYVPGPDLAKWIRARRNEGGPFDPRLACHVVHEVVAALEHAHGATGVDGNSLELVHRDVSPHNVLVSTDGAVKLGDFGIARAQSSDGGHTQAGTVKGKLAYMSPEQARGETVDARSDLYSATVILYELLSLERPHGLTMDPHVILRLHAGQYTPIEDVRSGLPSALRRLVRRGLAARPSDRFASAAEMRAELAAFVGELGGKSPMGRAQVSDALTRDLPDEVGRARRLVKRALSPPVAERTETIELVPADARTEPHRMPFAPGETARGPAPVPETAPVPEPAPAREPGPATEISASGVQPVAALTVVTAVLPRSRVPWALLFVVAIVLGGLGLVLVRTLLGRAGSTTSSVPVPALAPRPPVGPSSLAAPPPSPPATPPEVAPPAAAMEPHEAVPSGIGEPPVRTELPFVPDPPAEPRVEASDVPSAPAPGPAKRSARGPAAPHRPDGRSSAAARLTVRAPNGWAKVWVNGMGPFTAPFRDRAVPSGSLSIRFESPRGPSTTRRQAEQGEQIVVTAP
ncbi:MAG: protein kinase [Deltaproteobacteria bacterium]|nr:protein kinase [Deltaproteobacteria bacterium]